MSKEYQIVFVTKEYSVTTVDAVDKLHAEKLASDFLESGQVNTLPVSDLDIDIDSVKEV